MAAFNYLKSCRSRFSGVYLIFEVFQDACHSKKENPSVYWIATLSCPFTASNMMQIRISLRSHSDLVLDADDALEFFSYLALQACISFVAFQTKVEHKDLRALILCVGGGSLLLDFQGKEPPHKEFLGWDPNWGIFGVFLHVFVLFPP